MSSLGLAVSLCFIEAAVKHVKPIADLYLIWLRVSQLLSQKDTYSNVQPEPGPSQEEHLPALLARQCVEAQQVPGPLNTTQSVCHNHWYCSLVGWEQPVKEEKGFALFREPRWSYYLLQINRNRFSICVYITRCVFSK